MGVVGNSASFQSSPNFYLTGRAPPLARRGLVFTPEYVPERGDLGVEDGLAVFAGILEGGAVLKELLLSEVEAVDDQVVFLTDVGHPLLLLSEKAKQCDLLLRG
jgi:hypothetical protein